MTRSSIMAGTLSPGDVVKTMQGDTYVVLPGCEVLQEGDRVNAKNNPINSGWCYGIVGDRADANPRIVSARPIKNCAIETSDAEEEPL